MNIRRLSSFLVALFACASVDASTFNLFQPATGVLKGNSSTYVTTAAASSDIRALWSGTCDASTYLRGDGACQAAGGTPAGATNGDVQYKNGTAFAASDAYSYTESLDTGGGYFPSIMQLGDTAGATEGALFGTSVLTLSAFPTKLTSGANYFNYLNSGYLQLIAGFTNGGSVTLGAGVAPSTGDGGAMNIYAGDAAGTNQNGGTVQIVSGAKVGTGTAGDITFKVGGGSGSTALTLRNNLEWLVNGVAGTSGQVLTSGGPGVTPTWATAGGGGSPGGSNTQVQFNNSGAFGGDADYTYNSTLNTLTVGSIATPGIIQGAPGVAAAGGDISVKGGAAVEGIGGAVSLVAGTAATATATSRNGGPINVTGGLGVLNGLGGDVTITAGTGGASAGSIGGSVNLLGGPGGGATAGSVNITGGTPTASVAGAGQVLIKGGTGSGALGGGPTLVQGGGGGPSTGAGGSVTISGGTGGTTSGAGGAVSLTGGSTFSGNGSAVSVTAGNGVGTTKNGGNVTIKSGTATAGGTAGVIQLATNAGSIKGSIDNGSTYVDMTPAVSSVSRTVSGCTTTPSATITSARTGNIVAFTVSNFTCTSNATFMSFSSVFATSDFQPAHNFSCAVRAVDNGVNINAYMVYDTTSPGSLGFFTVAGTWTGSGTKGLPTGGSATCSFPVN